MAAWLYVKRISVTVATWAQFLFAKGILWLDAKLIPKVNTFMILKLIFGRVYE